MFWLKRCPKCQGDLHGDRDMHGSYVACLQCGHYLTPEEESALSSKRHGRFESARAYTEAAAQIPARSAA